MTKLCPRGKAAAKRKFKVYPSAYANAYASKICAGKIKDPSGTKRKDWGPKKAKTGVMVEKEEGKKQQKENVIKKIQQQRRTKQQRLEDLKKELGMKNGGVKSKNQVDPRKGLEFKKGKPKKGTSDHLGNPVVVREAKVGKLMTAGAQSGMGRLEKSGLIKAKKGKGIMIMIAVGKKKEPTKKMAGGMTSMRPKMMNKANGGKVCFDKENPKIQNLLPENVKDPRKMAAEGGMTSMRPRMMNKGGGADTGTMGERKSKLGVALQRVKRTMKKDGRLSRKDIEFAKETLKFKKMNKGGGADYMNTVKPRKRGNPAVVQEKRKTLKEKNKLVGGGEVRGAGAAIRGKHFQGVF